MNPKVVSSVRPSSKLRAWRLIMLGAAAGLVLGAIAGVGARLLSPSTAAVVGEPPEHTRLDIVETGWGEKVSPLGLLSEVHSQILESGGGLVVGEVASLTVAESRVRAVIRDVEIKWEYPPGTMRPGAAVSATSAYLGSDQGSLPAHLPSVGTRVVAAIAGNGELLGLAAVTDEDDLESFDPVPTGPFFLGSAGVVLARTALPPIPGRHCDASRVPGSQSALAALVDYFTQLGPITRDDRISALSAVDREVDRLIQSAPLLTDAVTGIEVPPAINDIQRQVMAGVSDLTVRPTYPIVIRLPNTTSTGAVLVFADSVTGQVASWIDLVPTGWVDASGVIHWNSELTAYVEAPLDGHDAVVYLRTIDDAQFDCPAAPGEEPLLVLSYDAAFGNHRAVLDLATLSVSELLPEYLVAGS